MRTVRFPSYCAALLVLITPLFSQSVATTISVGSRPFMVAANSRTHRVYVTNQYDYSLSVIDSTANQVITTIDFGADFMPSGVDVNPVTNRIYVVVRQWVVVLDGNTNKVVRGIHVKDGADRIAVNSKTNRIYVTNEGDHSVSVIDGVSSQVMATIPVDGSPVGVAVNPRTNLVYVSLFFCSSCGVVIIDGATNQIVTTKLLPAGSLDNVAVDPASNRVYVIDENAGMFVLDGKTNTLLGSITGLNAPETVAIVPSANLVVEADTGSNSAIFIDAESLSISQTVPVGVFPSGVAVDSDLRRVYITNGGSNSVSVIEY